MLPALSHGYINTPRVKLTDAGKFSHHLLMYQLLRWNMSQFVHKIWRQVISLLNRLEVHFFPNWGRKWVSVQPPSHGLITFSRQSFVCRTAGDFHHLFIFWMFITNITAAIKWNVVGRSWIRVCRLHPLCLRYETLFILLYSNGQNVETERFWKFCWDKPAYC